MAVTTLLEASQLGLSVRHLIFLVLPNHVVIKRYVLTILNDNINQAVLKYRQLELSMNMCRQNMNKLDILKVAWLVIKPLKFDMLLPKCKVSIGSKQKLKHPRHNADSKAEKEQ